VLPRHRDDTWAIVDWSHGPAEERRAAVLRTSASLPAALPSDAAAAVVLLDAKVKARIECELDRLADPGGERKFWSSRRMSAAPNTLSLLERPGDYAFDKLEESAEARPKSRAATPSEYYREAAENRSNRGKNREIIASDSRRKSII